MRPTVTFRVIKGLVIKGNHVLVIRRKQLVWEQDMLS